MELQNFECQIAKAQIGRYVAGDALSDEALKQLEQHVAKCPGCKQNLAERRALLQAVLSPDTPSDVESPESGHRARFDVAEFIRSKIQAKQPVQAAVNAPQPKTAAFAKPAMYSLALGAVLVGMSYLSRNMGSVLGPSAAQSVSHALPAAPKPESPKKSVEHKAKPPGPFASASAIGMVVDSPAQQYEPKPTQKTDNKRARKGSHHHRSRTTSTDTIRVYAPEE